MVFKYNMTKKILAVIAATIIQICLGGVYAWSIFVPMLKKQLGYVTTQTQIIVGLTLGIFAFSMIFAGKFEKKYGPMLAAIVGGVCLYSGYFLATISGGNFTVLCLGIGVLGGIGTGFCYVCTIVVAAKNFPLQKGLVTGIVVGGFGAGAMVLTYFIKYLISIQPDVQVLEIFKFLGYINGFTILTCSFLLNYDRTSVVQTTNDFAFLFTNKDFITLFVAMFAGSFAGLLVIGNVKPISLSLGFTDDIATTSILLLSFGNMSGRVIWGFVMDKVGVNKTLIVAYSILCISAIMVNFIAPSDTLLYICLLLVGLGYSSIFVLFVNKSAQIYGVDKLGVVYPYVFLSYGFAGIIGPLVGGLLFDLTQSYVYALVFSGILTAFAASFYTIRMKENA